MAWIVVCNENEGAVGTGPQQPKLFATREEAIDWIAKNKDSFPNCSLHPLEHKGVSHGVVSAVMETEETPNVSGYQIFTFDFSKF